MAVLTSNYKLSKPLKNEYYNIDIFNENMDKIDKALNTNAMSINNVPVKKLTAKVSSDMNAGDCIIVAEKGWYSNGSALIIIEASGALKHHSLVLSVSSSFYSDSRQISCLSNSNYSKQLFSAASIETVYQKDSMIYLTLNDNIESNSPVDLTITIISDIWNCCYKTLKANEVLTESTKKINLKSGKANIDLGLGAAAQKNVSYNVESSDANLITSKAVYDEMVKKQGKFTYLVAVKNKVNSDGSCDCDSSYINAADYVFDCTGATASSYTSTEGLNKFLKSLPLGSKVVFAPGSYLISNTIQVDTRLYLEGLNHMATFFTINDIVMLNIGDGINQASNVTVRNIYFRKWDFDSIPPTQENKSSRVFTKPVINVTKGNGVYIEKCGFYSHSNGYNAQNGYNSLVRYNDYCMNSVVEKCTLNTNVHYLINNGKRAGFTIDLANCDGTVASISIKFIANFGSITCYKPKSISSYETTFIGCTGVQEYNEDSVAVNALNSDEIEEV